ncbi:HEPN domain-containing protein [Arthrobacter sp. NicSoilB11]|uniref:HEPN domain-containing protein n=1 Tax=Arthrobacter sp. NicSoilB11 TaxID=2830999 RepID=UPI003208AA3D
MPQTTIAHPAAYSLWTRLESEFERYHKAISFIPVDQMRLQEDLRRYLCLRCAGFLEQLVYVCVHLYLDSTGGGPSRAFAKSFFSHAPNLNAESFAKLLGRFGEDHAARFDEFLTRPRRDSLNDLYSVRNPIAHGDVTGGQKLDPERYRRLCGEIYQWLTSDLLTPSAVSVNLARNADD